MLEDTDSSRRAHNTNQPDSRGRHHKLSTEHIDQMDEMLQTWDPEGKAVTWTQLAATAQAPLVFWLAIERTLKGLIYQKFIACTNFYVPEASLSMRHG